MLIHPTAIIDAAARLAPDVEVGPYALIEADVEIGEGCRIGGHAVIGRDTSMGRNNAISSHAVIGTVSQDLKYKGERSYLVIGDDNIFREFVTINRATGEGAATRIGDRNEIMACGHVAHNCVLGSDVIMANNSALGGESTVEDHATIGGLVGIHQGCRIGAYAYIGACSKVTQDILPFVRADGHPARPRGRNIIGLHRQGFSAEEIQNIKTAYRTLFHSGLLLHEAATALSERFPDDAHVQRWIRFINESRRQIARPRARQVDLNTNSQS